MGIGEQVTRRDGGPGCPRCGETRWLKRIMGIDAQRWECENCKAYGFFDPDADNPFELHPDLKIKQEARLRSVAESDAMPTPPVGGQRTGLQPPAWPDTRTAADVAAAMCDAAGVPGGPADGEYREQAMVFAEAFLIFIQRTDRHGSSWKQSGWRGALFDSRKKMDRLWQEFMINEEPPPDLDSALDLLNFVAFFVRGRANNIEGTWGWRN